MACGAESRYNYRVRTPVLRLNAVTKESRDETICRVKGSMDACGAWILNVTSFSNMSICFNFEIPGSSIPHLRDALAKTELLLSAETIDDLESVALRNLRSDVAGSLQITLMHNEPDLKIPVPAIPG